jgi:hypothetical protein
LSICLLVCVSLYDNEEDFISGYFHAAQSSAGTDSSPVKPKGKAKPEPKRTPKKDQKKEDAPSPGVAKDVKRQVTKDKIEKELVCLMLAFWFTCTSCVVLFFL